MAVYQDLRGGSIEADSKPDKTEGNSHGSEVARPLAGSMPSKTEISYTATEMTDATADSNLLSGANTRPNEKCSLPKGCQHGWRPLSTRGPVLVAFALCSLLLAACLEILAQKSHKNGGLAVAEDASSFPLGTTFCALYLPTIVAVIYSLAWNWIDLDIKRMQPWLELSKQGGATGQSSLFLDYPFDFVALVPFKAAKRRHWAVFYSGTIMVLIFWLVTPLQSSIIGLGPVLSRKNTTVVNPSKLLDVSDQAVNLDTGIVITLFAITFLDQPYPAFSTAEYALLPFQPKENATTAGNVGNWTGITTKYWADLDCWPAIGTLKKDEQGLFFDSGKGYKTSVNVSVSLDASHRYSMSYVGSENFLWQNNKRPANASDPFLFSWANTSVQADFKTNPKAPPAWNMSAIFCEPRYYKQTVSATVNAADLRPIDDLTKPLSTPEALGISEFDSEAFGYVLSDGPAATTAWRHANQISLAPRLKDLGRLDGNADTVILRPAVGFALYGQNYSIVEYDNTSKLSQAILPVYKSYFSLAMQRILMNDTNPNQSDGQVNYDKYGVVVSRVFSAVVEGFLCLVALLTLILYWSYRKSPVMLSQDPGWLGDLMGVIHSSNTVLDMFSSKGNLSDEKLLEACGQSHFQLVCGCQDHSGKTTLRVLDKGTWRGNHVQHSDPQQTGHYSPIHPLSLRRPVGALFAVCLCAGVAALAVLKQKEVELQGLKPASPNFEVNQIVINFLPTVLATLIEPFWVLLNRLVGIFQPFHDLISSNPDQRSAKQCLKARYAAMPPQLALWPAFRAKHYLLAAVSIIALLANVLAVGLGALFNELPVQVTTSIPIASFKDMKVTNESLDEFYKNILFTMKGTQLPGSYGDPFYVVYANLTSGTPFKPWITQEFAFMPVNISSLAVSEGDTYTALTTGIGADPLCHAIDPAVTTKPGAVINIPSDVLTGQAGICTTNFTLPRMAFNTTSADTLEGFAAYETSGTELNVDSRTTTFCPKTFYLGWSRAINSTQGTMNSSFLICRPELVTATFRVAFDAGGFIKNATPVSDFEPWVPFRDSDAKQDISGVVNSQMLSGPPATWHNTTVPSDWINHLLMFYLDDESFLDPATPTPDAKVLMPSVGAIYKMIVANYLGLNQYLFEGEKQTSTIAGTKTSTQMRVFLSQPALIVSLVILVLYVLTTVILYMRRTKPLLPRMPTTIGSLIAYVAPSKMLRDYSSGGLRNDSTLGFGRYIGTDGRAHIGIEYSDRVVPVDSKSLVKGDTKPSESSVSRLWHRKSAKKQGDTWL